MISDMYKVMASLGHVTKVVYFDGAWVDIDDLEDEDEYYS